MNQILDYNPNNKTGGSSGSDKIVRIFAIILIVFAICLLASGAYSLYKRNQDGKENTVASTQPEIKVEQKDANVVIIVNHDKAIEKIIYSWGESSEKNISGLGKSNLEETIPLPSGENVLHVKVIDINGVESKYEGKFVSEGGTDILSPVIDISITPEKKLKITATDETKLDFITYRWNDEKEQKIETSDDDKKIEVEIEILKGQNDLTVTAVDGNNNTTTETKNFNGVTKPEIKITVSADKSSIKVSASHEKGLKELKMNINGQDYDINIGNENPPMVEFDVTLADLKNEITVSAKSVDDTETTAKEEVNREVSESSEEQNNDQNENESNNNETETEIVINLSSDGTQGHIIVNDEIGIKEIKLNLNEVDYNVDIVEENPKSLEFDVPLTEGNNKIKVTVKNINGTEKTETKEISY